MHPYIEGGAGAALFASGMAAATAVVQGLMRPGDHMAVPKYSYFAIRVHFQQYCANGGMVGVGNRL